jgi:hypothetical protein
MDDLLFLLFGVYSRWRQGIVATVIRARVHTGYLGDITHYLSGDTKLPYNDSGIERSKAIACLQISNRKER